MDDKITFSVLSELETEAQADAMSVVVGILHELVAEIEDDGEDPSMAIEAALEFEQQLAARRKDLRPGGHDELSDVGLRMLDVVAKIKDGTLDAEE